MDHPGGQRSTMRGATPMADTGEEEFWLTRSESFLLERDMRKRLTKWTDAWIMRNKAAYDSRKVVQTSRQLFRQRLEAASKQMTKKDECSEAVKQVDDMIENVNFCLKECHELPTSWGVESLSNFNDYNCGVAHQSAMRCANDATKIREGLFGPFQAELVELLRNPNVARPETRTTKNSVPKPAEKSGKVGVASSTAGSEKLSAYRSALESMGGAVPKGISDIDIGRNSEQSDNDDIGGESMFL